MRAAKAISVLSLVRESVHISTMTGNAMNFLLSHLYTKAHALVLREEGQDLIEYALVVALIAFAATAGMGSLANSINAAFAQVGTTLSTYVS